MIKPTIQSADQRGRCYCIVLRSADHLQHPSTDQTCEFLFVVKNIQGYIDKLPSYNTFQLSIKY